MARSVEMALATSSIRVCHQLHFQTLSLSWLLPGGRRSGVVRDVGLMDQPLRDYDELELTADIRDRAASLPGP